MPRGNWRYILAVVGLVVLSLALWGTYDLYDASQQEHAHYDYQPAGHPSLYKGVPGQAVAPGYQPNCENPQNKETSDLCAQWAAVDQVTEANRMSSLNLRFAIASLWATAIATILLLWTLVETRETSRRELRAYMFADAAAIDDGTHHKRIPENAGKVASGVTIKNSGSTPAHAVTHYSAVAVGPIAAEAEICVIPELQEIHVSTVPPGGIVTAGRMTEKRPTQAEIELIKEGVWGVFVFGAITYEDVFGQRQRTDYRLSFSGVWPPPENPVMQFCASGNHAT